MITPLGFVFLNVCCCLHPIWNEHPRGVTISKIFMQMSQNGISPLIVYASTLMPQLVCYWISHMTLISQFKTSNWVQPCFSIYIACLNHNWYVLCKSTKSNRVKSNIVHKLHWIHSFGTLKLVDFKDVIAVHDYKKSAKMRTKLTWYLLTIVAYNAFLYIYGFLHMCIDWL